MQWAQALITDVHGARELHAPWTADHREKSKSNLISWSGSLLLLSRRHALSSRWLWTFNHNLRKPPGRSSRSCCQFSLPTTSLLRHVAACTAPVCGAQCSMPLRLGYWQSQTSNVCSGMTGQWSDRSAMSSRKTLSPSGPMSYLRSMALKIWISSYRREGSAGMDTWTAPRVQSRQSVTYRLMGSVGMGGLRWRGSSWNAPCHWDLAIDKAKLPTSAAEWQGNDQTDQQCQAARHCHRQVQWATCVAWHWRYGSHPIGEKAPLVWTRGPLQECSQDSLWHTG